MIIVIIGDDSLQGRGGTGRGGRRGKKGKEEEGRVPPLLFTI